MTISGVSFLGSSTAQTSRLKDLATTLNDLERQMTTQKKTDTLAGLGYDSLGVQRLHMDKNQLDGYLNNIDAANTRIGFMSSNMTGASTVGQQLIDSIQKQVLGGNLDMNEISTLAQQALDFLGDTMNVQLDGRYLFAGSDTTAQPFNNKTLLNTNMQTEVTNWLNGTTTTAQLEANVDAQTPTAVGLNPALSASGSVAVRADQNTEVDYTVKADNSGMQDIMKALGLAANLKAPAGGDTPTTAELTDVLRHIIGIAQKGIDSLNSANTAIGSKLDLLNNIKSSHEQDSATFETLFSNKENANTTEVVAQVNQLQTQLQASYQVTSIVSKLSLINYIS